MNEAMPEVGSSPRAFRSMVYESLTEKFLSQFLELKGLRIPRLARLDFAFANLAKSNFTSVGLAELLTNEISDLLGSQDLIRPDVIHTEQDSFLAVGNEYAIVTSGKARRYFPSVNEPLSDPSRAKVTLDLVANKVSEAVHTCSRHGNPISRLCFIEKSFGPVGLISVSSELVQRLQLPALSYRGYAWNSPETRISSGAPINGENVCIVYDVAVTGSALVHAKQYLRKFCNANVAAAVVHYDFEEGASKQLEGSLLLAVRKKSDFEKDLARVYRENFGSSMSEPLITLEQGFADRVRRLAGPVLDPEDSIISAVEEYLETHREQTNSKRLALGNRVLTWQDVVKEMRQRTPFGQRYLASLIKATVSRLTSIR